MICLWIVIMHEVPFISDLSASMIVACEVKKISSDYHLTWDGIEIRKKRCPTNE